MKNKKGKKMKENYENEKWRGWKIDRKKENKKLEKGKEKR